MKLRIKFSKQGSVKFIGHLDIMRYFQKAVKRSGIPICYSGGYHPHQIMSFAAPLGVGLTSNGEYMDIEVESVKNLQDAESPPHLRSAESIKDCLNAEMVEGIEILSGVFLSDESKNAMSIVAAADYTLRFRNGYEPADKPDFFRKLAEFTKRESIVILKKTKKGEKEIDIKPMIYKLSVKDDILFMQLAAGSANNLKPELVMQAFYQSLNLDLSPFAFEIQREELYAESPPHLRSAESADMGADNHRNLKTLEELGEKIEG